MQVVQRMGVVDAIRAHATGMDSITAFKLGSDRPVEVDLRPIFTVISDDHVEIMRDDLSDSPARRHRRRRRRVPVREDHYRAS